MDRWVDKVAVITGASSGIGAAIVEKLTAANVKVVGLARRKDKLDELATKVKPNKGTFYPLVIDVTNEDEIMEAFKWIKDNLGPIHILVNNAGVSRVTNLTEGKTKHWRDIFDTNVMGLCICTREAVKDMKANKVDGHIVHINSIAGHQIKNHQLNMYGASKHAVTALTETLRLELNSLKSKIKISSVSPGLVETGLVLAGAKESELPKIPDISTWFQNSPTIQSEDVAEAVMYVLSTPPHVQIHELIIKPVGEKV